MQAFKDTGKAPVETEVAIHRIRITLTSRNVKSLEKGESDEEGWLELNAWAMRTNFQQIHSGDCIRYSEPQLPKDGMGARACVCVCKL